jgi:hypothetical protein
MTLIRLLSAAAMIFVSSHAEESNFMDNNISAVKSLMEAAKNSQKNEKDLKTA